MGQYSEEEIITPRRSKSVGSSASESSSNYDKYLQLATEKNPVMLLELDQDGTIRYLSDLWEKIVGPRDCSQISDLIVGSPDDKHVFHRAIEMMLLNDSVSYTVTFNVFAKTNDEDRDQGDGHASKRDSGEEIADADEENQIMTLEACGILIRDNETKLPTHSMWTIKPYDPEWFCEETMADLPEEFVKRLGFGSTIFAEYLNLVEYEQCLDGPDLPPPKMELCRVCETFIPAWWLESHAQSCVCEHRIDSLIHLLHDNLVEQATMLENDPELSNGYKGLPVNIDTPASKNIVGSLRELCEISVNINPSELRAVNPDTTTEDLLINPITLTQENFEGYYDFSPRSKFNIQNVRSWQLSFREEIERDQGLALLVHETVSLAKEKVEALLRYDNAMTYSLRIKNEVNNWVVQLISQRIESNKANLRLLTEFADSPLEDTPSIEIHPNEPLRQEALIPSTALTEGSMIPSETSSGETSRNSHRNVSKSASQTDGSSAQHSTLNADSNSGRSRLSSKIESPQPHRPRSDLFSSPYLMADKLPSLELSPLDTTVGKRESGVRPYSSSSNSNMSISQPPNKSQSRSSTPGQKNDDRNQPFSFLRNTSGGTLHSSDKSDDHSGLFSSQGPTKIDSKGSVNPPKLKSTISLNPGRCSPLPAALTNSHGSQKSSISQPRGGAESSTSSPFVNSRGFLTPEQQPNSSNLPKQPLSPLLLATNQTKSPASSIKDYTILKPISKGAYGSVYLARKKLTGEYFAIKALRKSDMIAKNQVTNVKSERAIMMVQSEKPYVAPLYASFQNRDNLFLVMEYLPGGDLATLIKMMGYLPDEWAKQYISEVIIGVDDMHQNGIIHHDLKPDNLLIDSKGHVKLTDFGLSRAGLVRRHKNINTSKNLSISNMSSSQSPISPILGGAGAGGAGRTNHKRKSSLKHEYSENSLTSSPSAEEFYTRGRGYSESSANSHGDIHALKRSDSQVSFSITNISRSNTPTLPLFDTFHRQTDSNTSDKMIDSGNPIDLALFHPEDSKQDKNFFGTPDYLAPETIEGTGEGDACDWWSVGCILFEMLLGYPPFHADSPEEVFKNILAGNIEWPEFASPNDQKDFENSDVRDLISKLLVLHPSKRLGSDGAQEIMRHPYFRDVDWDRVYEEEPSFVPSVENLEDTDYFDLRGASIEDFGPDDDAREVTVEMGKEDQSHLSPASFSNDAHKRSSGASVVGQDSNTVQTPTNKLSPFALESDSHDNNNSTLSSPTMKHIPLAIPPHMRDRRVSKLNETQTEFGSFYYRNLSALDKANKDAINRLKNEHLTDSPNLHRRASSASHFSSSSESSGSKIKQGKLSASVSGSPGGNVMNRSSITRAGSPTFRPFSPDRGVNADFMGGHSRKGSGEIPTNFPGGYHLQFSEDSPNTSRMKSPVSPNTSISAAAGHGIVLPTLISSSSSMGSNRTKAITRSGSQRANSNEYNEEDRLQAFSKVQSMRYRRRSGRKSSNTKDVRYYMDVLICEPIPIHRYRLSKELEDLGCAVVAVGAGDELIGRATSGIRFDLIMTALKLPKLGAADIVSLLKHTRGINSATPVVAVTNYYQEAVSHNLFNDVLEKPVPSNSLREIVAKYALKKSQQQEETIFSDND